MKPILSFSLAVATALLSALNVAAEQASQGCFSSSAGLTFNGTYQYNSEGACGSACLAIAASVFAMTNSTCWCGNELPPTDTKTDDSDCTTSCPGYPQDTCGGANLWSVYLTGLTATVSNAADSSGTTPAAKASSTASSTTTAKPSIVTVGGQTVIVTASSSASTGTLSSSSSSGGASKAGMAVGVVVGLFVISAVATGIFLIMRNRRRREVEEEYRRNAAVSSFIAGGGKPPGSSGGTSFTDTRLDPAVMAHRRMSDGSIADNQDYSRRILKVTNA